MRTYKVLKLTLLKKLMSRRKRLPCQLTVDLVINHSTIRRRPHSRYTTTPHLCRNLVKHSAVPLDAIPPITGTNQEIDSDKSIDWPEFREYARKKYPVELDDDLITMIEDLIEHRSVIEYGNTGTKMGI